jgi:hypothetical protein
MRRVPLSSSGSRRVCASEVCLRPRYSCVCTAVAALALAAFTFASNVHAQNPAPTQFDVEAAYLYRFGNFVQWPPDSQPDKQFSICVLGHDPFGPVLDNMIKGSAIEGVPILARRVESAKDAVTCRILFLSSSEARHLDADLADLRDSPVLTVSDIPDFDVRGGMIQFVLIDRRVRFEINLSTAQKARLKLSSQLLKVAVAVRSDRNPKE